MSRLRSRPAGDRPCAPIVPPALYWPTWTDTPVGKLDLSRFDDAGHLIVHGRKARRLALPAAAAKAVGR